MVDPELAAAQALAHRHHRARREGLQAALAIFVVNKIAPCIAHLRDRESGWEFRRPKATQFAPGTPMLEPGVVGRAAECKTFHSGEKGLYALTISGKHLPDARREAAGGALDDLGQQAIGLAAAHVRALFLVAQDLAHLEHPLANRIGRTFLGGLRSLRGLPEELLASAMALLNRHVGQLEQAHVQKAHELDRLGRIDQLPGLGRTTRLDMLGVGTLLWDGNAAELPVVDAKGFEVTDLGERLVQTSLAVALGRRLQPFEMGVNTIGAHAVHSVPGLFQSLW